MLSITTLSVTDLLAEKGAERAPVLTISADTTVEETVKILKEKQILSAPVIDSGVIIGIVDLFDILQYIIHLYSRTSEDPQAEAQEFVKWYGDNWDVRRESFFSERVGAILGIASSDKGLNLSFSTDDILPEVVYQFAKGHHRAVVVGAADRQPLGVISQSDTIRTLRQHLEQPPLDVLRTKTVSELGLGVTVACKISQRSTALQGFFLMNHYHISAVAVVDDLGQPVANLSLSDLKGLSAENFTALLLPVLDYLDVYAPRSRVPPVTCSATTTFTDLLKLIDEHGIHRVWSVSTDGTLHGVVSLTDILIVTRQALLQEALGIVSSSASPAPATDSGVPIKQ